MKAKISLAILLIYLLGACKKEAAVSTVARQTQYTLIAQNNSGIWGTVTFTEMQALSQTQVDIEVNNATLYTYVAHIHQGPPNNYHGAVYIFGPFTEKNQHISYLQNIALSYDSAVVYNGTFVLHDSTANNVLGLCGIGINKQ